MENDERLRKYAIQVAARAAGPEGTFIADVSEDNPLLTPAMRRRLRHKEHVSHSHEELGGWEDGKGNWHRNPCPRCQTPRRPRLPIGTGR